MLFSLSPLSMRIPFSNNNYICCLLHAHCSAPQLYCSINVGASGQLGHRDRWEECDTCDTFFVVTEDVGR